MTLVHVPSIDRARYSELIDSLRSVQDFRCGICGCENNDRQLAVDHDHVTGLIRGLLCNGCNLEEGRHGTCKDPERCATCLWRLAPAVSWIGWTMRFINHFGRTEASECDHRWTDEWTPTAHMAGVPHSKEYAKHAARRRAERHTADAEFEANYERRQAEIFGERAS